MSSPVLQNIQAFTGIQKLLAVVAQLRDPETGCPWDLKQTHQSLRPYLLEEAYEAVEALTGDPAHAIYPQAVCEELGDVLLQVALHSQLATEAGTFTFNDVAQGIADKLIRRHPHVFGNTTVSSAEEVTQNWQAIKQAEKAAKQAAAGQTAAAAAAAAARVISGGNDELTLNSVLKEVSLAQPALSRALETSQKAVKVGFDWPSPEALWACVMSEFAELQAVLTETSPDLSRLEDELGDILFATVNLARSLNVHPEVALTAACQKFTRRFQTMERLLQEREPARLLDSLSFSEWDGLWREAKEICA